jgi:hypothetical protein
MFPAVWRDSGGAFDAGAGKRRNIEMAKYADALIAVWDGFSPGTGHMIQQARKHGLKLYVHSVVPVWSKIHEQHSHPYRHLP